MGLEALMLDQRPVFGEISFMGEQFFCDHEGCLYWPDKKCLIVSDLHLEKGAAMASRGALVPPYDSAETLQRLSRCIDRWQPQMVICLGDSFHRDDSADNLPESCREQLKNIMTGHKWVWIAGNHDRSHPVRLGGIGVEEFKIGPIIFRHEQSRHDPQQSDQPNGGQRDLFGNPPNNATTEIPCSSIGEISGHLHPVATIHRRAKRLRRRCFIADPHRLIMPAFGAYTGGLNVRNEAFSGLFDLGQLHVWMLGRGRVYKISANHLSN